MAYEDILTSVNVNYLGAVNVAMAAFDHLRRSEGQLLSFTSSSYTYGRAFYSLYSSSKAAVVNLTQALADEWNEDRVRVNCINPERTLTPMRTKAFGNENPDSLLSPDYVASISLATLLSSHSGQIINVSKP
jgi:2-C-methyl-D-erythritol 4-phosphate cytidylyltransferase